MRWNAAPVSWYRAEDVKSSGACNVDEEYQQPRRLYQPGLPGVRAQGEGMVQAVGLVCRQVCELRLCVRPQRAVRPVPGGVVPAVLRRPQAGLEPAEAEHRALRARFAPAQEIQELVVRQTHQELRGKSQTRA